MVKSRYTGDGHATFNRNPYNGYINPYGLGLMTIPYYMESSWELIDPGTYFNILLMVQKSGDHHRKGCMKFQMLQQMSELTIW